MEVVKIPTWMTCMTLMTEEQTITFQKKLDEWQFSQTTSCKLANKEENHLIS